MEPVAAVVATKALQAGEVTLLVAENRTGYFGVYLNKPGLPKPYQAKVWRGGKEVHLGMFATAEEAALHVARTPEGRAAAAERAAATAPLTSEEARQQAQAEKLTLVVTENRAGYFGVNLKPGLSKPYQARAWRGGKQVSLGYFATAEEAALYVARTPEGQAVAAERAAAAPPLTGEEARQQAQVEKLTLRVADSSTGYFGVWLDKPGKPKPYQARVWRGGKMVHLGTFATAEEAALCVARTPEGRATARRAAPAAEGQGTLPAVPSCASLKEEGTVPPMPPGAFVKHEGVVPPMPPDTFVKVEVVVKEEEGSGRPKRQRTL